jgi:peptidoglycan/LPS O-acetylase OafA/YrhL
MAEQLPATAKTNPVFSVKLEALRGLAALMVVGHHTFLDSWTHILFNGSAAVTLFFVLSGYVLGLSLRRGSGTRLKQFCLFLWNRVFRIYPAYFATTLAFWIYWQWYPFRGGGSGLLSLFANMHLTRLQQIENFLFLNQSINHVTWSLKVEMVGSVVLPLLHFLSRKLRWRGSILLLAAMVLLSFVPSSGNSRQCLYMFYLGYLITDIERLPKFAGRAYSMILCAATVLFLAANFLGTIAGSRFELLVEAVSAAGIILCIQSGGSSLGGILDHRWTHFAGRVSYSVYQRISVPLADFGHRQSTVVSHASSDLFPALPGLSGPLAEIAGFDAARAAFRRRRVSLDRSAVHQAGQDARARRAMANRQGFVIRLRRIRKFSAGRRAFYPEAARC